MREPLALTLLVLRIFLIDNIESSLTAYDFAVGSALLD